MDSFAALPPWAIIGVFAMIGAGAGGSATYFLRKRFPNAPTLRFLPIVATLAGAALGTLLALPTIRATDTPVTCEGAQDLATERNATAPGTQVDGVTTVIDMWVDCGSMQISFRLAVDLSIAEITDEDWATAQANVSNGRCRSPLWRRYMEAGWVLVNEYSFRDGGNRAMTASCEAAVDPAAPLP